jgi:hypothetical protein
MLRRLLPLALALVAAPAALADGLAVPSGVDGVSAPGGKVRYLAVSDRGRTMVEQIQVAGMRVLRARSLRGAWVVPGVALDNTPGGLSGDGGTLVLTRPLTSAYPTWSDFQVVRTRDLAPVQRVHLRGSFSYDALSPDGSRLYLIQHVQNPTLNRYVVRAYDLGRRRLLPGRIADRAQRGWVMAGWPVTRATSADGRWAYTLYARPGGMPFVHALDTTRGVAHCIGIPWRSENQNALWRLRLSVRDGGRTLSLHWRSGRDFLTVARGTWRISRPAAARTGSAFPWGTVGIALALVAAAALAVLGRRRIAAWRRGPLRLRHLLPLGVLALVAVPIAHADGDAAPIASNGVVVAPGGKIRYGTLANGRSTTVNASHLNGVVIRWRDIRGHWGIPGVTVDGVAGGLSGDGRTLVLVRAQTVRLPTRSVFQVVRTSDLAPLQRVVLKGNFDFDALSPDGSRLYLIQHVSQQNLSRYVVRAYDLVRRRLLPGRIADRAQRGWVMAGYSVARASSTDGRWIYTLYARPGGTPFVHALDAVRGVAHCVGIPWNAANQNVLWQMRLSVRDGGRTLRMSWPSGREYLAITRGTWRISHPGATVRTGSGSAFPWWIVGVAGAGALLLLTAYGRARRRTGRSGSASASAPDAPLKRGAGAAA